MPTRRALSVATLVAVLTSLLVFTPAAVADHGAGHTTKCVGIWTQFSFDGDTPDSRTVPVPLVDGHVVSVVVDLSDFGHPEPMSQPGERVSVALGDTVVATTPDLGDDETRRQYTLPVGRTLTFDSVTVTHAPIEVPDDIFVKTVCIEFTDDPGPSSSTSTVPGDGSTTTTSTPSTSSSSTTSVPTDGSTTSTTTTTSPTTTSPTTSVPTDGPTTSTSTTSTPATTSSTTVPGEGSTTTSSTTVPVPTVAPPTTIPGQGSYVAECTSGATTAAGFVWTAAGSVSDTVVPGEPITLSSQVWQVAIPASVLENARQAGLIAIGDTFEVVIGATIAATDTVEGEQSQSGIVGSVTVGDAGDGSAASAQVAVAADDMTFTPTGDRVAFRLAAGSILLRIGPDVEVVCGFDVQQPPIVVTPPGEIAGPPELAVTGPSPLLVAGIVVFVLLDVGYLAWSATRPRRAAVA